MASKTVTIWYLQGCPQSMLAQCCAAQLFEKNMNEQKCERTAHFAASPGGLVSTAMNFVIAGYLKPIPLYSVSVIGLACANSLIGVCFSLSFICY